MPCNDEKTHSSHIHIAQHRSLLSRDKCIQRIRALDVDALNALRRKKPDRFACSLAKHYLSFNSASNSSSFRRIFGKNIFDNVCFTFVRCAESFTSDGLTVTSNSRSSSSP
jgi:hypothetical protein